MAARCEPCGCSANISARYRIIFDKHYNFVKSDYKKSGLIAQIGIALHREALKLDTGMNMLDTEYACEVLELLSCNEGVKITVEIK